MKVDYYQIGIPSDREQYIHRLGRTGREGKEGEGILLLAPWEEYFLDEIKDLPLEKIPLPHLDPDIKLKVSVQLDTCLSCISRRDIFKLDPTNLLSL